ncbi:hypothetical protein [Oceanibacterium hippocampi]|uniref:Uncharacterized protein n=1 Tax=Oceanibacterium hippocampi TaxID=745714 RepID=A0A1Y5RJD8_9PROT|nr:hypothetical protein [Oceanibacterium hippocampi]SLN18728.1 hypothetical protein OCH7691_00410 [Oceanibacterium hippocampi]
MKRLFVLYATIALCTFLVQGITDRFVARCDFDMAACALRLPGYSANALLWPYYWLNHLA